MYRGGGLFSQDVLDISGPIPNHIVLRSLITRTILPGPTISTNFSCQLSSTLIACPPPSPGPLDEICENPVPCGDSFFDEAAVGCEPCDMPLYLNEPFFRNQSRSEQPIKFGMQGLLRKASLVRRRGRTSISSRHPASPHRQVICKFDSASATYPIV